MLTVTPTIWQVLARPRDRLPSLEFALRSHEKGPFTLSGTTTLSTIEKPLDALTEQKKKGGAASTAPDETCGLPPYHIMRGKKV